MYINILTNPTENRISKLYEIIASDDKTLIMPKNVTKEELISYINMMIKDAQPRLKRTEGRPSVLIDDYKIPDNYFMIESNSVNFHSSMGTTIIFDEPVDDTKVDLDVDTDEVTVKEKGITVTVPNRFREDDVGQQIVLYIFKHGRKTLEELIAELSSLDKHMLILLVNKLVVDKYLRMFTEEDGTETLELVEREKDIKSIEDKNT